MGMLMRRHYDNRAEGATKTKQVAPKPVPKTEPVVNVNVEVEVEQEKPAKEAKKPSRMEIMRMNVATVRAYAEEQGIEGASAMSGAELKRILVNKMFEEESE